MALYLENGYIIMESDGDVVIIRESILRIKYLNFIRIVQI